MSCNHSDDGIKFIEFRTREPTNDQIDTNKIYHQVPQVVDGLGERIVTPDPRPTVLSSKLEDTQTIEKPSSRRYVTKKRR